MKTDKLLDMLSDNLAPAPRAIVARNLGLGLLGGMAATFAILLVTLGLRHDLAAAVMGAAFWIKITYTFALAVLGLWLVERQSRASADARIPGLLLFAPVLLLAAVTALQIKAPQADWRELAMGHTARVCSLLILALSLPIFAGLLGRCAGWLRHGLPWGALAPDCWRARRARRFIACTARKPPRRSS